MVLENQNREVGKLQRNLFYKNRYDWIDKPIKIPRVFPCPLPPLSRNEFPYLEDGNGGRGWGRRLSYSARFSVNSRHSLTTVRLISIWFDCIFLIFLTEDGAYANESLHLWIYRDVECCRWIRAADRWSDSPRMRRIRWNRYKFCREHYRCTHAASVNGSCAPPSLLL